MKKFNVQIETDSAEELYLGLLHAADCVDTDPQRYEQMAVDDSDEMSDADPKVTLYRSE